jgi:lipopolysaccharide transport system ATP-binding protein
MIPPIIKVENLSKQYQIGERLGYRTFRETLVDFAKLPFRKLKNLNSIKPVRPAPKPETIWALKNISFKVEAGEVIGIIGRNGAGKTTLLKILAKITEPTEGRVELRGRVGSLLEIGTGFHPELTGHENIYLYGAILGMNRWEVTRKFDEIVAFAGLEKFVETPVKRYSSGMYMRLAFSVAAHLDPEILLVDEVLAVGDLAFQRKCMGKMESVSGAGQTVLFVSHNMAAIQRLCHKTVILNDGKVMFFGNTLRAIEKYSLNDRISSQVEISLADHPNRIPGSKPILRKIEISVNGLPSAVVGMGDALQIALEMLSDQAVRGVGLIFEDSFGRRILTASTDYTRPELLGHSSRSGRLKCKIPEMPLLPGIYYVTAIAVGFTGVLDKIERVLRFTVTERDIFNTGKYPTQGKGVFYTFADWEFEKSE